MGSSSLNNGGLSPFKISANNLASREDLRTIYFVNGLYGWAAGGNKIYKTEDGASTWQLVGIEVPPGATIGKIAFLNQKSGWLILEKTSPFIVNYKENHFWIFHTSDGGQKWQLQYDRSDAKATNLFLDDGGAAWVSGVQYKGIGRYGYLILSSKDAGQHWEDLSANLKRIAAANKGISPDEINDAVVGSFPSPPNKATIITGQMEIFRTDSSGNDWRQVTVIGGQSDQQSGVRRFSITNNRMWFAKSTDSTEGVRSVLVVEGDNGSWSGNELDGIYFADAVALSTREFLACGYIKSTPGKGKKYSVSREGIVLYSSDKGKTWSIVYRNANVKSLNAIATVDLNHIYAVGDSGLIIQLKS